MLKAKLIILCVMMLLISVLVANVAQAATSVSGTISSNTTWTTAASPYYVTSSVTINAGVTLTVQAGTVVKFAQAQGLFVNGTLNAVGAAGSEIVFTDFRDDTVGGDSNGDGGATPPAPGWWRGIEINNLGTAILTRCVVRYAGSAYANVYKTGTGDLSVSNSSFRDSSNYGIYLNGATTASTITGNTISGNVQYGIFADGNSPASVSGNTISSNGRFGVYANVTNPSTFTVSTNTFNNNGLAPIGVAAASSGIAVAANNTLTGKNYVYVEGGAIASNQTWGNGGVSVYYIADDITIGSGQTLTVQPGTVVKFAQGRALYFTGHLNAPGTTDNRIYFTDFRDDIGGDSNGDGTATAPAAGWWRGIELNNFARATMNYCVVRYGSSSVGGQANLYKGGAGNVSISNSVFGNGAYKGISLVGATGTVSVTQTEIANNAAYGIYLSGSGSSPTITKSEISASNIGIYCADSANPIIGGSLANANDIFNNFEYSVQNTATSDINATYNWWGRSGGPLSSGFNKVSSNVNSGNYLAGSAFGNSASTPGAPVTTIAGGTINGSVPWPLSGSPYYVSGNVTVASGATLTISSGVVVKFANRVGFDISGTLNATGVTFTDSRDDAAGGDTNGDGPASTPAPGWWRGILVHDGGNATISNCVIRYGGSDGPNSSNLYKTGATGSLQVSGSSTISHSSSYGIYLNSAANATTINGNTFSNNAADGILAGGNSPATVSANTFTGNGRYGIYASVSTPTTFTVSANTFIFNGSAPIGVTSESSGIVLASDNTGLSHVQVEGGAISATNPTWGNASVPITYYVSNNVTVSAGPTLEILPGTVVKFANRIGLDISGELIASNVTFTDYRDDTAGGDTNANGSASAPAPGWWRGILVHDGGNATITDCVIRYGGSDGPNSSNLYKTGANGSLQVSGATISFSSGYGIYLNAAANATTITNTTFRNNGADGILAVGNSPATVSGNTYTGNGRYGIYASVSTPTAFTVSANTFTFNGTAPIGVTSESSGIALAAGNSGLSHVQVEGGAISANSHTWGNATVPITYYVSGNVNVTASPTLTIRSGTVVKFANRVGFDISGRLNATGVTFTDFRDDTAGGDSNGDSSASSPAPGWWRGILVNDGGNATITNCVIRYGGSDGPNSSNLYKTGANGTLQVSGSTIAFSSSYGIYLNSAAVTTSITGTSFSNNAADGILAGGNSPATISGNSFTGNGRYGIYTNSTASSAFSIRNNTFTANVSTPIRMTAVGSGAEVTDDNSFSGPLVVEGGNIGASLTWLNNRVYYASGVITVPVGATLTIPAGRVVKFAQNTHYAIYGHLQAVGTSGNRIVFTDYRDDDYGGDSDGVSATPEPNWWYGILIYDGGSGTFDYATVRYAGLGSYGGIYKTGSGNLSVSNSILEKSSTFGLRFNASSGNHTVSYNIVRDNASHGILIQTGGASVVVSDNTVSSSGSHGIYLDNTPVTVSGNTVSGSSGAYGLYITGAALPTSVTSNILNGNGLGGVGMAADSSGAVIADSNTFNGPLHVEGGSITRNTDWVNNRVYYARGVITINAAVTLTVPAGRVVKFAQNTHYAISGHLQAVGTSGNRIIFTDYRDDEYGGDSDGVSATPAPNWWYGILINDGGSGTIDYATVRYAGLGSYGGIYKSGSGSLSLSNSVIEKSSTYGLQLVNSGGNHTVSSNMVRDNGSHGILIQSCSGAITVSNTTARTNGAYGVALGNSASGVTISASTFENNTQGGIYAGDSSPLIQGNIIRYNNAYGIHATGASTAANIYKNTIFGQGVGVYCTVSANPRIGGSAANSNNIVNNSAYGVQNTSASFAVNARSNWWGASTGPYHATNLLGTGNAVSDYVDFTGFLASPDVPIAIEQVSPPLKAFGHVTTNTTSAPQVFTITNTGVANLVFSSSSSSITGTNADQFRITQDLCAGHSLATNASCTITARFEPTVSRPALAFLTIVSNDIYTPTLSIPLTGAGSIVLPFRDDFSNSTRSPHWFVINEDPEKYNLTEMPGYLRIYTTPTNFWGNTNNAKNLFVVALPSGVSRFVATAKVLFPDILSYPTPNQNYQQGGVTFMSEKNGGPDMDNYVRAQYAFDAGRRFETSYDIDGVPGGYQGATIDSISSLTPVWIRIIRKATEYTAEYSLDGSNYTLITAMTGPWDISYVGLHALNGDQSLAPSIPIDIDYFEVYELPAISVTPLSSDFSSVSVNQTSPPATFTISNAGPGPLTISSITLNGSDPGMFAVNNGTCGNLPVSINPNNNCAFSVTFRPTTNGLKTANISISSNDIEIPVTNLQLSGKTSYLLTLTLNGTGNGTVNSSANFSCTSGNVCSNRFDYGSIVNLYATHGADSLFTGWSGACSGSNCSVTMTTNRNVTGTFTLSTFPKVQIQRNSFGYQTVQDAYNDAQSGDVTQILSGVIDGPPLSAQRGINITLKGGYELIINEDQSYSFSATNVGTTVLQGTLTISVGTVIIDKITLK